jgi:hypothetical protein
MPPKAKRIFTCDAETGEIRCQDPSCAIAQCGQCNVEQNKRRRDARRKENEAAAKAQKEKTDEAAIAEAKAAEAAGKNYNWTYDREEEGEGEKAMAALVSSGDGEGEKAMAALVSSGDGALSPGLESSSPAQASRGGEFQLEKSRGKTTWNHTTRTLLYNCIAKFNPFAAPVKKDAWNTVAIEMAQSTALMFDAKQGDFRVKTDGHGLEVFYARRVEEMNKKTSEEASLSGQAGAEVTKEQALEYATLQACVAKEKDAALIKDKKRQSKSALEDIKNNKVTQAVKNAALENETVKARTFKLLQNKVRAAKLEAAVWEKQHGGLGKYSYSAAQLADIEYLSVLKRDFPEESDALPESDGVAEKKRGGVAQAIGDLIAKLPTSAPTPVDVTQFAQAFFEAKGSYQQRQLAPRKRTLGERLADLKQQCADGHITEEEMLHYETEIKKNYFMQD